MSDRSTSTPTGRTYWWCLTHARVERDGEGCSNNDRMGPYPTEAEAARALQTARERTAALDAAEAAEDE